MAHAWKACWVQALGGSNPPSSATEPRDRFRFRGFCCLWRRWCSRRRWCSGRRRARPPARSPHASLTARSGRSRSPPVPSGPSGALHTGGTCGAWTSPARPRRPPALRPGHAALAAKPRGSVVAGNRPVTALLSPGLVPLKLRGLRRSLRPGVQPGPRPSQRASIGAGPSRCSSIRPSTPSR